MSAYDKMDFNKKREFLKWLESLDPIECELYKKGIREIINGNDEDEDENEDEDEDEDEWI